MGFESEEKAPENDAGNDRLSELAGRWQERYFDLLQKAEDDPSITLETLTDLVWEKGILDHVAPLDEEERRARHILKKDVLERNDSKLYWRMLFSAVGARESNRKNYTMAHGSVNGPVLQAGIRFGQRKDIFSGSSDTIHSIFVLFDAIIEKAKKELIARGQEVKAIIPEGTKGVLRDIPIILERYTDDGYATLKAFSAEDHMKLGEIAFKMTGRYSAVFPESLDPADFGISGTPKV